MALARIDKLLYFLLFVFIMQIHARRSRSPRASANERRLPPLLLPPLSGPCPGGSASEVVFTRPSPSDQRHCRLALAPAPASEVLFQRVQLHSDGSDSDNRLLFVGMHPLARPASHLRLAAAFLVTSIGASMSSAAIVRPWGSVYDLNEGSSRHHVLRASSSFSSIVSAKLEN